MYICIFKLVHNINNVHMYIQVSTKYKQCTQYICILYMNPALPVLLSILNIKTLTEL